MVVANAYGNLLSLSTSSYWYSPKMNLTCSSLLTFRLSEGGTYRSRRAFADLALGALNSTPNIVLSLDVKKFSFEIDLWWFGYTLTRFSNVVLLLLFDIWVEFGLLSLHQFYQLSHFINSFFLLLMSHEFDRCILSCLMSFRGTSCCALLRPLPLWSNWTQDVRCSYYNKWQILGSDDAAA